MHRERRRTIALILAATACLAAQLLVGCTQQQKPTASPLEAVWDSPTSAQPTASTAPAAEHNAQSDAPADSAAIAATEPAEAAPVDEIVAIVNGKAITRGRMVDMLVDSRGVAILEQLILLTAARQKAADMGLTVTANDITAAEDDALRRIAAPLGDPEEAPLDRPAAEKLLEDFLRLKGLSHTEWRCRMEQRACLAKIAQAEAAKKDVTEQMLRDEYALAYGEKVQIRHIQTSSPEAINRAAALLDSKSIEEVAREISENAITREQGGLMPPFTRHDTAVPPFIREKAFSMKTGERSQPLREGAYYHIIQVERTFPASSVGFENVDKDTLRNRLLDRVVRQRIDALDTELFQAARVDIRDPALARAFREKHRKQ